MPDRTRTVGRVLHVGSPLTLLICPANCRRAQWLGNRMLALLLGWSTAPTQNASSWRVGTRGSARTPLLPLLAVAAAGAVQKRSAAAAPLADCWLAVVKRRVHSTAIRSSSACSSVPCIGLPCDRCCCIPCKRPLACGVAQPMTVDVLASLANVASSCRRRCCRCRCCRLRCLLPHELPG